MCLLSLRAFRLRFDLVVEVASSMIDIRAGAAFMDVSGDRGDVIVR